MHQGKLVLIMGPSGSGKNTLKDYVRRVFEERFTYIVSYTTRAIRPGEEEGRTYHYITTEEFQRMVHDNIFIEWAEYGGNFYGIPRADVEQGIAAGRILFREVELRGYEQIKKQLPKEYYTLIFVDGGDWEHLTKRIMARSSMSEMELALRKKSYEAEMDIKHEADYVIVNEDGKVSEACRAIEAVMREILTHNTGAL